MEVSAEIRWFWPDACPEGLEAWFRDASPPAGGGKAREDVYLRDPGQPELGLKRRGGKPGLEVKGLIARLEPGLAEGPLAGPIEIWSKWRTGALDLAGRPVVTLEKRRWLRKLDTGGADPREIALDADEKPVSGERLPWQGCNVELTRVGLAGGAVWWTLGFEAFGGLGDVERSLRRAAAVLAARRPPDLARGRLMGYPAWLAACVAPQERG